jgi:hypothetical protein
MFENRVLRRTFGPNRDEVTGEWRKLHNEELHDLYSPIIVRVIKYRRMRCEGLVARMVGRIGAYRVLVGRSDGKRYHLGHLGLYGTIILKWNFKK